MMEKVMKIEMEAVLENQSLARAVAAAYVSEMDPTIEEITEIKTAVSEAVSNAAIHGYPGAMKGSLWMELGKVNKDTFMVKITDKGVGISNIEKAREPLFTTADSDDCCGMGFTVMESFMDKVNVHSVPGEGTTVTMIKKLDTYYGF